MPVQWPTREDRRLRIQRKAEVFSQAPIVGDLVNRHPAATGNRHAYQGGVARCRCPEGVAIRQYPHPKQVQPIRFPVSLYRERVDENCEFAEWRLRAGRDINTRLRSTVSGVLERTGELRGGGGGHATNRCPDHPLVLSLFADFGESLPSFLLAGFFTLAINSLSLFQMVCVWKTAAIGRGEQM